MGCRGVGGFLGRWAITQGLREGGGKSVRQEGVSAVRMGVRMVRKVRRRRGRWEGKGRR